MAGLLRLEKSISRFVRRRRSAKTTGAWRDPDRSNLVLGWKDNCVQLFSSSGKVAPDRSHRPGHAADFRDARGRGVLLSFLVARWKIPGRHGRESGAHGCVLRGDEDLERFAFVPGPMGLLELGKRQQVFIYGCISGKTRRRYLPHQHSPRRLGEAKRCGRNQPWKLRRTVCEPNARRSTGDHEPYRRGSDLFVALAAVRWTRSDLSPPNS